MSDSPLGDRLARQYQEFIYPRPIADLASLPADRHDACDPAAYHLLFWPDREKPADLYILAAGCGANQTAVLAFRNPKARVLGIDISETALEHEHRLKLRHNLANLELRHLPIEEVASLGRQFDVIACSGVLHHMADPLGGARALGTLLKPDGVMAVMLYARHGRAGIEMLQQMFRRLGLGRDQPSLAVVREVLQRLPPSHPARPLLDGAEDVTHDGGLIDLLLNARERSYTVPDCLALVSEAGLAFQGWFDNAQYYPELWFGAGSDTYRRVAALTEREIWAAMELMLASEIDRHIFVACRADRDPARYRIDFAGARVADWVPSWISGWGLDGEGQPGLAREGMVIPLGEAEAALAAGIDGSRPAGALPGSADRVRAFLRTLWRAGMIRMRI